MTHWKRPWCWEGLGAGEEGDDRGLDGWMSLLTWWTCVWVNSGSWWWTGRPGVQQFMGLQRIGHDWVNWTISFRIMHFEIYLCYHVCQSFLFTVEWYSVIYQFFHPFTNWWLRSCFQLLPNRNRAITSICIQDFMQTKVFISLGFLPKSRIAKSLIIYWFKGWGTILLIC